MFNKIDFSIKDEEPMFSTYDNLNMKALRLDQAIWQGVLLRKNEYQTYDGLVNMNAWPTLEGEFFENAGFFDRTMNRW